MHIRRAPLLFSPVRLAACRRLFHNGLQAFWKLAFLGRGAVRVQLKNGKTLAFSRGARDHNLWDWFLSHPGNDVDFTADGQVLLQTPTHRLLLRPGTTDGFFFKEVFLNDTYGIADFPGRFDTVVDLGGNVGLFTSAVLPRARRVITVEPLPWLYEQARKNIVNNGGDPADLHRFALDGVSGREVTLIIDPKNTGAASMHRPKNGKSDKGRSKNGKPDRSVAAVTISLGDLLERAGVGEVDFLKCDIEGAEYPTLLQAPLDVLRRIRRLAMEVHPFVDDFPAKKDALIARLQEAGMQTLLIDPHSRRANPCYVLKAQRAA